MQITAMSAGGVGWLRLSCHQTKKHAMKPVITVEPSWTKRRKKRTCCEVAEHMAVVEGVVSGK